MHQCNSQRFKGESPSTETLQPLLGSAGGCPEHVQEGPAQTLFLRKQVHTSYLYQKPPLLSTSRAPAVPSELPSGPPAPKTWCWELNVSLQEDSVTSFTIQAKGEFICSNFSSSGQTFSCPCFAMGKGSSLQK